MCVQCATGKIVASAGHGAASPTFIHGTASQRLSYVCRRHIAVQLAHEQLRSRASRGFHGVSGGGSGWLLRRPGARKDSTLSLFSDSDGGGGGRDDENDGRAAGGAAGAADDRPSRRGHIGGSSSDGSHAHVAVPTTALHKDEAGSGEGRS
jgi:hypothetical protein